MSLADLLSQPDVNVPQLFQQPDILNQIKYKIQIFLDFCKRNEDFTKIMITLGIKTPMYKNENIEMRKVSHVASEILTCDNDVIADLFVIDQRIRCYSQDDDQVIEQIISNQTTGELVIVDRKPQKDQKQIDEFTKKYMYLIDLLSYIQQQKYLDQNCINYMAKVFNTVVRVKGEHVYQFFTKKPQLLKKMIQLTHYPSISYSIAKLINQTQDAKFRTAKIDIINMMIKQFLQKVKNNNFSIYIEFVQQIFQKNRHRSQEVDQIKIVTQPLVSKQIIQAMLQGVFSNSSPIITSNSILYLLKVIDRMNADEQKDPYNYNETTQNNKPTMDFQAGCIFSNFDKLINLAPSINRQKYTTIQILSFYDLLLGICLNSRFKTIEINKINAIITLVKILTENQSKYNGIIKNKIVLLIQNVLRKQPSDLQSIQKQIQEKLTNLQIISISKQGVCYIEKLKTLLCPNADNGISLKYSGLLAPTSYTQNRNVKIKQLQFAKLAKKQQKVQETTTETSKVENKQTEKQKQNGVQQINGQIVSKQVNGDKNKNGVGININALNDKINALKSKKQHKSQQQTPKIQQQKQNQTQIKTQQQKDTKDNEKSIQNKSPTKQKKPKQHIHHDKHPIFQKQKYKNQQLAHFYTRYLILF